MDDVLITEHAGTRRDEISRFYQYGSGGVRVLDTRKAVKRLYRFDPASDIMTERDPVRQDKILRRFVFDKYGMLEETFAFGERPRTFRYENGARQIAVREGGDYGAVGKIITFEENGITETAWGRNGEIEHVFQFDPKGDAITVRAGGWYGDVERTLVFEGIRAFLFSEPEAFLQFRMFTEWSANDKDEHINERVAEIRGGQAASGRSPSAYSGGRFSPKSPGEGSRRGQVPQRSGVKSGGVQADPGIDFIPDGDAPGAGSPRGGQPPSRPSREISFAERRGPDDDGRGELSRGRSAEIPLDERFGSSRREPEKLSKGRSAEIPLDERFESAHRDPEQLSKGRSAEIPLDERFESSQREREKLTRGKSAEIPYSERRGGRDR
jgi:hypothetical protein